MACLMREGWMEVTVMSRGVEISITGGIAETEDDLCEASVPVAIDLGDIIDSQNHIILIIYLISKNMANKILF